MRTIDYDEARALLERAVAEFGPETCYADRDPNYDPTTPWGDPSTSCKYVGDDNKGLCLIGVVLIDYLGVDPELLRAQELATVLGVLTAGLPGLAFTRAATQLLSYAQGEQDGDNAWGRAVTNALHHTSREPNE